MLNGELANQHSIHYYGIYAKPEVVLPNGTFLRPNQQLQHAITKPNLGKDYYDDFMYSDEMRIKTRTFKERRFYVPNQDKKFGTVVNGFNSKGYLIQKGTDNEIRFYNLELCLKSGGSK